MTKKVWIALSGERGEGASVIGVYADKKSADAKCKEASSGPRFLECDYVEVEEWEVAYKTATAQELIKGTRSLSSAEMDEAVGFIPLQVSKTCIEVDTNTRIKTVEEVIRLHDQPVIESWHPDYMDVMVDALDQAEAQVKRLSKYEWWVNKYHPDAGVDDE